MAITASIAVSSATALAEQAVVATMTVSNGNAADVFVTGIQTTLTPNGATQQSVAAAVGQPVWGGGFNATVVASSTAKFSWSVTAHAPTTSYGLAEPASYIYSVGATVTTSDGSVTVATPTTLTVTNPAGL